MRSKTSRQSLLFKNLRADLGYKSPSSKNLGLILVGIIFNTYLFGLVSGQFVTYYTSGVKDPLWIRIMVHSMVLTDTFHSIALMYLAWVYCAEDFAHPEKVQYQVWPFASTPIADEVAAIVTQIFLGYRIYCWTRSRLLFGFIFAGALAAFILGCVVSAGAFSASTLVKISSATTERTFATVWISVQVITDLLIVGILVTLLLAARTTSKQTNTVISRLTRAAVQTSAFGAIFAFTILITFLAFPQSTLYSLFGFAVPRLYTNTMMYTLNMREELRDVLNQSDVFSLSGIESHSRGPTFGTGVLVFQESTMATRDTSHLSSERK